jgi:hypothetical protein
MKKNHRLLLFSLIIVAGFAFLLGSEPVLPGMAICPENFSKIQYGGQLIGLLLVLAGSAGFYLSLKKSAGQKAEW